ncbi:hypothetical protein NSK_005722 [Nannochloropsis salina CCMP1776]|uniref:Uncharacterized protein n=1 Tax=Nannochloropsis salina CCMP1776 TaxID=1027361 RepID=A0A4D9D2X0_9STRA|nr:hypothetical protein NSK_005722 [Nannochloropsis salina CCMP1776]|eukprot:TFJ82949.1 hypothetical protein NSK_005722 [Nannochloropsis salina CCMP1776]
MHFLAQRYPATDRALLDLNSLLLIGPVTLIAAVLGSILNAVLPEAIIYTGLHIILALFACYSVQKIMKLFHSEGGWAHVCSRQTESSASLGGRNDKRDGGKIVSDRGERKITPESFKEEAKCEKIVVGNSDYGATNRAPAPSATPSLASSSSKKKKKTLLVPVGDGLHGGMEDGIEGEVWASPFQETIYTFSPSKPFEPSPTHEAAEVEEEMTRLTNGSEDR